MTCFVYRKNVWTVDKILIDITQVQLVISIWLLQITSLEYFVNWLTLTNCCQNVCVGRILKWFGPELIMFRTIAFFNYSESQLLRDFQLPTWSCIVICDCIKSSQFRSLLCTQSFEHSNVYCHKRLQLTIKLSSNGITKIFWTQLANFIQIQI